MSDTQTTTTENQGEPEQPAPTEAQQPQWRTTGRVGELLDTSPWVRALIFGDPGGGKTVFGCDSPTPLHIDVANEKLSLLNHPDIAARTMFFDVESFNDLGMLFLDLANGAYPDRETIVVDNITELQGEGLDEHLNKTSGDSKWGRLHPILPTQADFNVSTQAMRRMAHFYRSLDRHIIFIAHMDETKDDRTKVMQKRPAITPKLARTFWGMVDFQGFFYRAMGEDNQLHRYLMSGYSPTILTKTRIGGLPDVLVDPKFQTLIDAKHKMLEDARAGKENTP
jgi:hypothetical protein